MQSYMDSNTKNNKVVKQIDGYDNPEIIQTGLINNYLNENLDSMDGDEIVEILREARDLNDFSKIAIGRMVSALRKRHGEITIKELSKETGISPSTLSQYKWVAEKFPNIKNYQGLSFSYFRIAAGTKDPEGWIKKAIDNGWNVTQFSKKVKGIILASECEHIETETIIIKRCKECNVVISREVVNG